MIKIQIKSIYGSILFEYEKENNTIKDTVLEAKKTGADLTGANLTGADLTGADLTRANLTGANLYRADLTGANLTGANLTGANLTGANLYRANLTGANLTGANLYRADLTGADLTGANLTGANLQLLKSILQICPEEGSFIAWKKGKNSEIIKLMIPAEARRTCNTKSRKCRAEFANVIEIINSKGDKVTECYSQHDMSFKYAVGEKVTPDRYDDNFFEDCSNGIHFFISKYEAENY